jgi:RNA polymerase sigma factor (TIGR02999 family)
MVQATGDPDEVTQLLLAWSDGDKAALEKLTTLVYKELHRLARHYMATERSDHTLQATALVNEAYLRLVDSKPIRLQNRAHFFAVSAQLMRRILVDFARKHQRSKRGGGQRAISLEDVAVVSPATGQDLVALDNALRRLSEIDSRKVQVVELRFFGGLSVDETADVLKVSPFTVLRDWNLAKAWLRRDLSGDWDGNALA